MSKKETVHLKRMTVRSLREMDQTQAQGWVIQRAIEIEQEINFIISKYFEPKHGNIFSQIVLNSSVMNFGGKIKVLRAIGIDKSMCSQLQQLGAIRNAFAHTNMNYQFSISNGQGKKTETSTKPNITVMNSAGELKAKDPYEYMVEFLNLYKIVQPVLRAKFEELTGKS